MAKLPAEPRSLKASERRVTSQGRFFKHFRLRHGLSQTRMAGLVAVPARRLALWENGTEEPGTAHVSRLMDLAQNLPAELVAGLSRAVVRCELPRALCRSERLTLQALSGPAIDKRPSIVGWMGQDLLPIACGMLVEMLDDLALQNAIRKREVAGVVATTRSVLRTAEAETIGAYRTTINYSFHDGVIFSDAVALPVSLDERAGYTPIFVDEVGADLFGDRDKLEAALAGAPVLGPRAA